MSDKIYFPGLNALRFMAALMVIVAHIEGFKKKMDLPNLMTNNIINQLGSQGVKVFFVLSGFLITYLLLTEKERFGQIDIRKFYIRRVLRIWPLYFLVLCVGFFVMPYIIEPAGFTSVHPYFLAKLLLAIFLLPNLLFLAFGHIFTIGPLWSIGAEEQFYLVWPNIVQRSSKLLKTLLIILLLFMVVKAGCDLVFTLSIFSEKINKAFWVLNKLLQFDCMIIGAIFAYLLYNKHSLLKLIYKPLTLMFSFALFLVLSIYKPNLYFLSNIVFSAIYGILILNVSTNPKSIIKLENKFFNFLGKISYGLYMFHSFVIILMIHILKDSAQDWLLINVLLYISSIILTIGISYLSYNFFEKPILKYKERFMKVKSSHAKN